MEYAKTMFYGFLYTAGAIVFAWTATLICIGISMGIKGTIALWINMHASEHLLEQLKRDADLHL